VEDLGAVRQGNREICRTGRNRPFQAIRIYPGELTRSFEPAPGQDSSCWRDNNLLNLLNIRPALQYRRGKQNGVPSGSNRAVKSGALKARKTSRRMCRTLKSVGRRALGVSSVVALFGRSLAGVDGQRSGAPRQHVELRPRYRLFPDIVDADLLTSERRFRT
jgi:hypothetical protein